MIHHLIQFLLHWGVIVIALWVTSAIFKGISFSSYQALLVSALMLGFANAFIRPVLIFFTLPLTLVTLGGFLLVINALMIMLVSSLVKGFKVSGFWTAFFASIFVAIFSFIVESYLLSESIVFTPMHAPVGITV